MQQFWRSILDEFRYHLVGEPALREITRGLSGAVVVCVTDQKNSYALRGWPEQSFEVQRLRELHRFLAYLKQFDLPVSVPVSTTSNGKSLIWKRNQYWQLEPWLSGTPAGSELDQFTMQSIMETLARVHQAARDYIPSEFGRQWFLPREQVVPAIIERLGLIAQRDAKRFARYRTTLLSAPGEFQSVCRSILGQYEHHVGGVAAKLSDLSRCVTLTFPCWRDLWKEHVLVSAGQVSGLIDPAATRVDHPGTDLSRILGSLFEDDPQKWSLALQNYQQVAELSIVDLQILSALRESSVLLSGLTWIDRWEYHAIPESQLSEVIERLQVLDRRMQSLKRPVEF